MFGYKKLLCHVPFGRVLPKMFGERRDVLVALSACLTVQQFFESAGIALRNPPDNKIAGK